MIIIRGSPAIWKRGTKDAQTILYFPSKNVSVLEVGFEIPLLTLFAALWLHESDTGLFAPTVSQLAL